MARSIQQVCWIHGWGMSSEVWGDLSSLWPAARHHYMNYESSESTEDFHRDLQAILRRNEGPWTLVGWSMGGMLALEEVFRGEFQFAAVVLISATLRFVSEDRTKGWPIRVVERMRKRLSTEPELITEQFALSMFTAEELQAVGKPMVDTDFTYAGLSAGLTYLIETDLTRQWEAWRRKDNQPECSRLLWIHGAKDAICPPGFLPELADGECISLEDTGHAPMLSNPSLLKEKLRRLLYGD